MHESIGHDWLVTDAQGRQTLALPHSGIAVRPICATDPAYVLVADADRLGFIYDLPAGPGPIRQIRLPLEVVSLAHVTCSRNLLLWRGQGVHATGQGA